MKRCRTSADLGLCKNLKNDKKRCVLVVICTTSIAVVSLLFTAAYLVILLSETARIADARSQPAKPRPFEVALTPTSATPRRFRPTFATLTPTTERTTASYPQLSHYRQHHYPRSVQEVIDYVTDKPPQTRSRLADLNPYKPEDPGEVNLMATGRVRFAHPPLWKNRLKKFARRPIPIRGYFNASEPPGVFRSPRLVRVPDNTDVLATVKKPVMVSINIAPMNSENSTKRDAMTLNLRVYPDMTYFNENRS
ncbi:unnamed protein product [Phyllotreta striolata]|uniref:Uncharacterized protein n=1 Tax=Phyllotreta striolata TaxID=444603 RepID=A0A9N9TZK7_PHYSR|nr:unnamed protein product [Phyllotreta striolata]